MFWPGVDKWPPPKWIWVAAAIIAFVVMPILILLGTVGAVVYVVIVVVGLILGANSRLRNVGAEDFWRSRPPE